MSSSNAKLRSAGKALAGLGVAALMTSCAQWTPAAAPQQPPAPSTVTVTKGADADSTSGSDDEGKSSSSESKTTSNSQKTGSSKTTRTSRSRAAQMDPSVWVGNFDLRPTEPKATVSQRPATWVPPHMTDSSSPSNLQLQNCHWATWDRHGARGNCDALMQGGGGPPTVTEHARLLFSNARAVQGRIQYTHYRIEWPDDEQPDERDLNYPLPAE